MYSWGIFVRINTNSRFLLAAQTWVKVFLNKNNSISPQKNIQY